MTIMSTTLFHEISGALNRARAELSGLRGTWCAAKAQRRRAARLRAELSAYDDRELDDLGISRGDIRWVAARA